MSAPDDDRPDDVDDEELAELADELSGVLRELRDELAATREAREAGEAEIVEPEPSSGGGGVPDIPFDLPSATDVLAFTDEKLIPAAITVLEVNIRALELLQKGIRWARPDNAGENAQRVRSHAESVSRSTLQRLDTVLADLQDAAGRGALPDDAAASDVITEARSLRDEIDAALQQRADARERDEADDAPGDESEDLGEDDARSDPFGLDDQPEVDVDVESELESIKAELGKDEDDEPAGDGTDEDDEPTGEGTDEDDEPTGEGTDEDEPTADDGGDEASPAEDSPGTGTADDGDDGDDGAGSPSDDGPDGSDGPASLGENDDEGSDTETDPWAANDDCGGGAEGDDSDDER